jgi:hypothetical protein
MKIKGFKAKFSLKIIYFKVVGMEKGSPHWHNLFTSHKVENGGQVVTGRAGLSFEKNSRHPIGNPRSYL